MTSAEVRIGVGTRLVYDGELVEIVEIHTGQTGMDVVLKGTSKQALIRARLNELLMSNGTRVITERDGPSGDDDFEPAGVVLAQLSDAERNEVIERAAHVRELLTGFRSGSEELALPGEPRPEYQADVPLSRRYASKARELGVGVRSIERWVQQFQKKGEAGLASTRDRRTAGLGANVDPRWTETADRPARAGARGRVLPHQGAPLAKAKGAVAIDAFPGLGKTTSVLAFAREYHRREIKALGATTDSGHERWPVCRVGSTGNTGMKEFNRAMLEFFAHPGAGRGTAADYARRALDCTLSCEVRVLVIDDLHFLQWRNSSGIAISNHFKYIANEFPVTMIFIGVGLAARGLFSEGSDYQDAVLAQTGRRTTALGMDPFAVNTEPGRRQWRQLLLAVEQRVVLADEHTGMIADELCDYLYARSTGHIGSLMTLINRGCQRAVRSGEEKLTVELLDEVKNDAASEKARQELELAINTGKIRVRRKAG